METRGPALGGWLLFVPIVLLAATAELWAPDEPRYAEVAREAWGAGGLLVMHLNGAVYPDKPPLLYWLAGASGKLGGFTELALRIPSLLATAGAAWLVARLARRFFGELEARWAATFQLGTAMALYMGGRVQIDPLLAFLCLAAIERFTAEAKDSREASSSMRAAGLCVGLAALAKGPVAWILVGAPLVAWRFLPGALRFAPPRRRRDWIELVLLAVLPVALWAAAAIAVDPELARPLLFGQHLERALEGKQHPGPPWDHLVGMPPQLLPWTLLFLAALASAWRTRRTREPSEAWAVRVAVWLLVVFAFFSAIPTKRSLYLLPIYPAAALLCARELARLQRAGGLPRWIGWGTCALLAIAGSGLVLSIPLVQWAASHGIGRSAELAPGFAEVAPLARWVGAPLLVAAVLAALAKDARAWAERIAWGFAGAGVVFALAVAPAINPFKSAREVALFLAARPEKPHEIPCYGVQPEGYRFYGGVPTVKAELEPALEREGRQFLGLIDPDNWRAMPSERRARFRVLRDVETVGRDVVVLGAAP